jgi:hypothetical protein
MRERGEGRVTNSYKERRAYTHQCGVWHMTNRHCFPRRWWRGRRIIWSASTDGNSLGHGFAARTENRLNHTVGIEIKLVPVYLRDIRQSSPILNTYLGVLPEIFRYYILWERIWRLGPHWGLVRTQKLVNMIIVFLCEGCAIDKYSKNSFKQQKMCCYDETCKAFDNPAFNVEAEVRPAGGQVWKAIFSPGRLNRRKTTRILEQRWSVNTAPSFLGCPEKV